MADNVVANAGSGGATFATDEVPAASGIHYPRTKQVWGADGTATDVAAGASALPIQDGGNSITVDGTVSVSGTVAVTDTVSLADKATFTEGTTPFTPIGGTFNGAMADLTAGQSGAVRLSKYRNLTVEPHLFNAPISSSNPLPVDDIGITNKQVLGIVAHDGPTGAGTKPLLIGGFARATAPTDVSADQDAVNGWFLRNGAQATVLTAAGALIGGDATNGIDVDVTRVTGTVTVADNQVIADNAGFTDGTSKVFPAGYIFDETAGTALTENDAGAARMDSKRALVVGIEDRTTRGQRTAVDASGNLAVAPKAAATGGATIGKVLSAASTNATNLKASAGKVIDIALVNTNAAVRYLHLYNKASAPTVGTDVPVATIAIPGNAAGAGISIPSNIGLDFSTGISYSLTTGPADTDAVAVALNEITGWITYK